MGPEEILIPLAILLLIAVAVCVIVLPIVAILHAQRIARLTARLRQLEDRLQEGAAFTTPVETVAPAVPYVKLEQPITATLVALETSADPVAPAWSPSGAEPAAPTVEEWIGRRGLGWVAVVLLLFATAFFLKQVFENRWIGETGRVAIGVLAGVGLCMTGLRYHRRQWQVFSQMLTSGGVVLLYLSTFAAFGYYHLLPREHAAFFLVGLVAETALLAVLYEAPAIALMALIGALLAPPLLHTDRDQYRALFMYLATVDAGVLALACFRAWPAIGTVALLGTQGLFWGWYAQSYHPEKLAAAIVFQVAVFFIFTAYGLVMHVWRRRNANVEDLVRTILVAVLFFAAAYTLLDEDYHVWMGTFALAMAIVYTALGWLALARRSDDQPQLLLSVAVAMGFLAMVFPLQAEAAWIAVGWAVEGVVLWWFGLRIRSAALRGMAAAMLVLAVGRLVFVDTPDAHNAVFVPLLNQYGLPAMAVAACLMGAAGLASRFRKHYTSGTGPFFGRNALLASAPRTENMDLSLSIAMWLAGLGGIALVWLILSVETYDYFVVQISRRPAVVCSPAGQGLVNELGQPLGAEFAQHADSLHRMAQTALSVAWAVYAVVLMITGFWCKTAYLRYISLGLFGILLIKIFILDMSTVKSVYRIAAFLATGITLVGVSYLYQYLKKKGFFEAVLTGEKL